MPVPAACSLAYCSAVLMITRPGRTFATTPAEPELVPLPPLPGCGTALLGSGCGAWACGLFPACGAAVLLLAGWYRATTRPAPSAPASSATIRWLNMPARRLGGRGGGGIGGNGAVYP